MICGPAQPVETTAAVPLAYDDHLHGVFVMNGRHGTEFSEHALDGLASLGRLAGFALTALRTREILLSDAVTEFELAVTDPESFCSAVASALGCRFRLDRSVPLEGTRVLNYHRVEGAEPARVRELAAKTDRIEDAQVIWERSGEFVFPTVTEASLSSLPSGQARRFRRTAVRRYRRGGRYRWPRTPGGA